MRFAFATATATSLDGVGPAERCSSVVDHAGGPHIHGGQAHYRTNIYIRVARGVSFAHACNELWAVVGL